MLALGGDADAVDLVFFRFDITDDAGDGDLFVARCFAFRDPKTRVGSLDALFAVLAANALKQATKFVGA